MKVYGYDPFISVDAAWNLSKDIKHIANVEDIYENCDYITVHVPLMDSTKKMINADAFAKMKDGVIVLNLKQPLQRVRSESISQISRMQRQLR